MKKLLILGTSLAMLLSAGIAMADDQKVTEANDAVVFQSLGNVEVAPMTNDALEATEGKAFACIAGCASFQSQLAGIGQANASLGSALVGQFNTAAIVQSQN